MERISEMTERTLTVLFQNYMLWVLFFVLILIFAVYIYLSPNAPFEGFRTDPQSKKIPANINRVR